MKKKNSKGKKIVIMIFVFFTVFTSFQIITLIYKGKRDLSEMNKRIESYEKEIKSLENKKAEINLNIAKIDEDSQIEKIARDKLNMVKEGETVYKVVE